MTQEPRAEIPATTVWVPDRPDVQYLAQRQKQRPMDTREQTTRQARDQQQ